MLPCLAFAILKLQFAMHYKCHSKHMRRI